MLLNICFMVEMAIKFIRLCANDEGVATRYVLSSQLC